MAQRQGPRFDPTLQSDQRLLSDEAGDEARERKALAIDLLARCVFDGGPGQEKRFFAQ